MLPAGRRRTLALLPARQQLLAVCALHRASPPPSPTSRRALYRNLLLITAAPPCPVQRAIDYYFDSPSALHSTRSFNLLIGLALRNASFASVARLFSAMRAESTPENMETYKLHVRWLVRSGRWNDAWKRALQVAGDQDVSTALPINPVPLPIWLELFGSQHRNVPRRRTVTARKSGRLDSGVQLTEISAQLPRNRLLSSLHQPAQVSRYRALMRVSPLLASSGRVQILPRTIFIITQTMYQVGQRTLALSTALSYLKSLPPRLKRCDRRRVLDLVNLHLSMATRHKKSGLKRHFTQRRILRDFLHARPDVVPSSTTLFLLLGSLRGCRRSGTLAIQYLHLFEKRWGSHVLSSLVRRRVASLALKEGRLDIVKTMLRSQWRRGFADDTPPRTVCTLARRPWRTLFRRRGAENQRWLLVAQKYRRRLLSRSESKAT